MAKKFLQMDGTDGDQPDPTWNNAEAEKKGLIPVAPPPITFGKIVPQKAKNPLQIIRERDNLLAAAARSNGNPE